MADDVQANIGLNIDTSKALSGLKALQSELSALHTQLSKLGPTQRAQAAGVQRSLIDNINATGKFAASMTTVKTTAESFTHALEKNKLTMGEYFRYAGGASKSFGKNFAREFATIEKVAVERVKSLQTQYIKLGRDANGAMRSIAVRPLALDMNNLQTKTAIAAQKQQLLNQLLKQGSTQMLNWGKNTQWAGRQLMVGFSIPLGIFAGKAMQAFSNMEKQIISFKRVYGDLSTSAKDTDAMAESIKKLAGEFTKYGIAVSDTIDMAAKAAAMGKAGADLLGQVQQASKLAALGQVDQQQALKTTISLTDTFGTATEDLGKKINFLNAVENQTILSIEDMTTAIPKAGPVVKQLGGNVEDLAFFLTAMREGGINASEGANALKSGLASIINPTGKASAMLKGFGINLDGIVQKNKGDVRGTVIEFAKALDKLDPLNRAKAIEQLFGKFQFARISTLMKNVASDSSQAAMTAQLAQKSSIELAAIAARELRKVSSSPLFKFQKAIQDFQTQMAPIGETFMKVLTPIIDWVNGMLKAFNGLGDGTKTFIVGFTSVVAGLGPILLMTFGLIANGFANLIKGFASIKNIFNRVQTSSQILGQETRYMTEEQIKAQAVAASLDQVHGKLIQTFNVEAGAVGKLASAYERAVTASQRLMPGAVGTKTRATKKLAGGGILNGPGTGTSDSIPAMLSNGEAVIPARHVSENRPLVESLISGKVNKFKSGYLPPYKSSYRSEAQIKHDAEQKAKLEADPAYQKRMAARRAGYKSELPQAFLYDERIAGKLTKDSPVAKRMILDQMIGKIFFSTWQDPISFAVSKQLKELGTMGLSMARYSAVKPNQTYALGKNYRINAYGPMGEIAKKWAKGGINNNGSAVVAFGAHQPFTVAHEKIAGMGKEMASQSGIPFKQFSTSQGKSARSLLTDRLKKKLIKESIGLTPEIVKNPFAMMSSLSEQGIKKVTLLLGQDRMDSKVFDLAAKEYGIKLDKVGIPRDPLSPSGTQTRLAIKNNDVEAYQKLIASGASQSTKSKVFSQMRAAMGIPKLAGGGIISGPGTGTSDSILARVSNREAIIPAKSVSRFPNVVNGLIDGNLPGFKDGRKTLGARLKKKTTTEFAPSAIRNQSKSMDWQGKGKEFSIMENLAQELGIDLNSPESLRKRDKVNYMNVDSSHLKEDVSMRDIGFGAKRGFKNWKPDNLFADWGSINKGINDIKSGKSMSSTGGKVKAQFAEKLQSISKSLDMDPKEVDSIAKKIFKGNHVVNQKQRAVAEKIMGLAFENAATPSEKLKYGSAQRILKSRAKSSFYDPAEVKKRKYTFSEEANKRYQNQSVASVSKELANASKLEREAYLKTQGQSQSKIDEGNKQVVATKRSTKAKEETATADESTAKSAKQIARDTLTAAKAKKAAGKRMSRAETEAYNAYVQRQQAAKEKSATTRAKTKAKSQAQQDYMMREYGTTTPTQQMIITRRAERNQKDKERKIAGRNRAEERVRSAKPASIFGFSKASRDARRAGAANFGGGKAMGVGMGISIAGSAAGAAIGGDVGNTVANAANTAGSLAFAASMFPKLGPAIAAFLPEIAIAATAIGGFALILDVATKAERDRVKALQDNAKASNVSTDTMTKLADFFGTTTKTDAYFASPMPSGTKSGMGLVVDELRKNEGFKASFKDQKWGEALKSGTPQSNTALLNSLAIRFGADLAPDAVSAIILAIQKEAGIQPITINFKSIDVKTKKGRKGILENVKQSLDTIASAPITNYEKNQKRVKALEKYIAIQQKKRSDAEKITSASAGTYTPQQETIALNARELATQKIAQYQEEAARLKLATSQDPGVSAMVEDAANKQKTALISLNAAYRAGSITADEYKQSSKQLRENFLLFLKDSERGKPIIDSMIDSNSLWNDEEKKVAKSLKSTKDAYNLLAASVVNSDKAFKLARKIQGLQQAMDTSSGAERRKYNDEIERTRKLLGLEALKTPPKPDPFADPTTDPYNTSKDTLTTKQNAQLKKVQDGQAYLGLLEEDINKKYEDRINALDKVAQLNQEIAASQRDQLDLADALSRGDIAAAARAQQTMRANDAQRAFDQQKQSLETAQTNEVNNLKVKIDGVWYTKDQLAVKESKLNKLSARNAIKNNTASIKGVATGGHIMGRGTGTSDDIPAMLSNGEYVIRAKAVKALGVDTLDKMNHAEKFGVGGFARKYADGGIIERLRAFRNNERKYPQPSKLAPVVLPQMLKRTKLAARTTQDALMSMIAGDGRYKNAFETGSGEDFKDVNLASRAKWVRLNMEADALGIPKLAKPEARPTYGSLVTDSKITESINRTLGGALGKRFNLVADINSDQLDRYGDVSLIAKNRVKNRSTFYTGDTLETYARNGHFGKDNFGPEPITGKPSDILKRAALDKLAIRFGHNQIGENAYSVNNKPRYLETQTPGGFSLDDVAKIRVHSSDADAKNVLDDLRNAGIKTKVYGPSGRRIMPSIASTLLRSLGRFAGPEGMFLMDALLGTNSMTLPKIPGAMSTSPSGAFANGGMVGPRSADAMERWKNKNAKKASPTWIKAARDAIPQGRSSEQPSAPSWWNPDAWMSDLFGLGYGAKTTPNINASVKPMTQDAAGAYVDLVSGSPWLAGQVSGKPVDASGWDALAVAGVLPVGKLAKLPGISKLIDPEGLGRTYLKDYVSRPLTLHNPGNDFARKNVDQFIKDNNLVIPSGSDIVRVTNENDRKALSLIKPGQAFKSDQFFSITSGSSEDFISGMRRAEIQTGGRWSGGGQYPLIKYNVKSDVPGIRDINDLFAGAEKPSNVVDGLLGRGIPMKLRKITTDRSGLMTYHIDLGGKIKSNLGLNEISKINYMASSSERLAKAVKNGEMSLEDFNRYKDLYKIDELIGDFGKIRNREKISGMTDSLAMGPITKTYQRFLKDPTHFANGGMASKMKPSYFNAGGLARGTDTIPAMLTPGEFVMTRSAVQNFGVDNLKSINSGDVSVAPSGSTSSSDSVYNYSINVNVSSMSDPNDIAKTVMTQIKRIDSQKVRGIYRG